MGTLMGEMPFRFTAGDARLVASASIAASSAVLPLALGAAVALVGVTWGVIELRRRRRADQVAGAIHQVEHFIGGRRYDGAQSLVAATRMVDVTWSRRQVLEQLCRDVSGEWYVITVVVDILGGARVNDLLPLTSEMAAEWLKPYPHAYEHFFGRRAPR